MWIEKADIRLASDVEVKTSRNGREFAVARGYFPAPKDSPRDTPKVWVGITIFAEDMDGVRTLMKGDSITFKGKLESTSYTKRDGTPVTEPRLVINDVLETKKSDYNSGETRAAIKGVGQKFGAGPVDSGTTFSDLPADDNEELPF